MARYEYFTLDVFTTTRFGGNPLAVFPNAAGLDVAQMQALAAEMNYSETTFVMPPTDPSNTARVRIFNRTEEMAFAGHPNVGTAYLLSREGLAGSSFRFEELAGVVEVRLLQERNEAIGAEVTAPHPLTVKEALPAALVAEALSIAEVDISFDVHEPVVAGVGFDFALVQAESSALARATPNVSAFRTLATARPQATNGLAVLLYALDGDLVRARMFAPLSGTWEDPATGAANAALAALRLSYTSSTSTTYEVLQGAEMGRPSRLIARAWRASHGYRAAVGGRCVPVFKGIVDL